MIIALVVGNLGSDPSVGFTPSGMKITSFSVASNNKRQGKEETTWVKIIVFGDHLDKMISYLKKGSSVMVSGSMQHNKWTDKEGREQTTLEVIADSIRFTPTSRAAEPGQAQAQKPNSYASPLSSPLPNRTTSLRGSASLCSSSTSCSSTSCSL